MKAKLGIHLLIKSPIIIWIGWVISFYLAWLYLVSSHDLWGKILSNWEIAFAMLVGSYAAGSTPMGGGSVGFPVLVMFMELPAQLGRDFSFAIQSIGMTSASILIFCRMQKVDFTILKGAFLGALIGTPFGILVVSPLVDGLIIKIIFSTIWAGFGVLHVIRLKEISKNSNYKTPSSLLKMKFVIGFFASLISTSTVCGVTGVGVDMVIYCVLILLFRSDLKIAVPTSVVIMAFTSIIGVGVKFLGGGFEAGVFDFWLAAAPVVILGAPLGVLVVDLIGRNKTLFFVALICVGQYIWVCMDEYLNMGFIGIFLSTSSVFMVVYFLEILRSKGMKLANSYSGDITSDVLVAKPSLKFL